MKNKNWKKVMVSITDLRAVPALSAMRWMRLSSDEVERVDWGNIVHRGGQKVIVLPLSGGKKREWRVIPKGLWAEIENYCPHHRRRLFKESSLVLAKLVREASKDSARMQEYPRSQRRNE